VLQRLSTFDWSFTQNTAALVLRELTVDGKPIRNIRLREVFDNFRKRGLLRYVFGEYFLPSHVREVVEAQMAKESHHETAQRHFAVGAALAPYWTATEFPGLAYDAAFIPERVHEAQHHLSKAGALFFLAKDKAGQAAARSAQRQVMRFGRVASWGTALGLIQGRSARDCKYVYLFIEDFMERWRTHLGSKSPVSNHPTHLAMAAKALHYAGLRDAEIPHISERYWRGVSEQSQAITNLFERAREACAAFPGEREYNCLFVLSEYSDYLESQGSKVQERLQELNKEIRSMQASWAKCPGAVRGRWFEAQGDNCRDHGEAALIYADGAECAKAWHQLKVKGAGALLLKQLRHRLLDDLRTLPKLDNEETALKLLGGAKIAKENQYRAPGKWDDEAWATKNSHIFSRWDAGLGFLRDVWKPYPRCRRFLADL
jgi:hypothetical protein